MKMKIIKLDETTYEVDGVGVWLNGGIARCCECTGLVVAMSKSCRHARAVKRLTKRAADSPKAGAKSAVSRVRKSKVIRPAKSG